jgi:hypothetical protein
MRIENFKEGDHIEILKLFTKSFGKDLSYDFWKWRFEDNPFGKHMIKLCWEDDILIGHYAVSPIEFIHNGNIDQGSLSMTTMTHPDWSGKGIFGKLAQDLYKDLEEIYNHSFVYGFPNSNSHYGFVKNLGWEDLGTIPTLSLKRFQNFSSSISFSTYNNFEKVKVKEADNKFTIHKTQKYLDWRYTNNPINEYKIHSIDNQTIVFKTFKSFTDPNKIEIDILELFCEANINIIMDLISSIIMDIEFEKIASINIWLPLDDKRHILFEKIGFQLSSPITFIGLKTFGNSKRSNFNDFYFSMGNSDIY